MAIVVSFSFFFWFIQHTNRQRNVRKKARKKELIIKVHDSSLNLDKNIHTHQTTCIYIMEPYFFLTNEFIVLDFALFFDKFRETHTHYWLNERKFFYLYSWFWNIFILSFSILGFFSVRLKCGSFMLLGFSLISFVIFGFI